MKEENWEEFIGKSKEEYRKIGYVECPAFGNERVFFTMSGFRHLIRKGRKKRTEDQQMRRLSLFPYIEKIIRTSKQFSRHRRHDGNITKKSITQFWSLVARINGKLIIVIIRQIDLRPKHFFSVFDE